MAGSDMCTVLSRSRVWGEAAQEQPGEWKLTQRGAGGGVMV